MNKMNLIINNFDDLLVTLQYQSILKKYNILFSINKK